VCVLSTYNNLLFGNDLSNNVDDISKANRIATKLTGYDRGRSRPTTAVCVPFLSKSSRSRFWRNYDNTRQQYSPIQYRNQSKNTATHSVQKNNQWIRWVHIVSVILCLRFMSGLKLLLILRFYKLSQRIVLSSRQNPHNFLHQNNIHGWKMNMTSFNWKLISCSANEQSLNQNIRWMSFCRIYFLSLRKRVILDQL
jgi:hypothetical protein